MSTTPSIFFLGATGYIGGSILVGLQRQWPDFKYTAMVRNPKSFAAVEALSVTVVKGANEDVELIEKTASEHDIAVNCSDADDLNLANAIINGLKKRAHSGAGDRKPFYLHTSGTGLANDKPLGMMLDGPTYDDSSLESIKSIPDEAWHRNVDLAIAAADEEDIIDTYIIAPSTIYGKGVGPVKTMSQQVNDMIRTGLKHKELLFPGPGTNIWSNVHILDLMDLYNLVFSLALSGKNSNRGFENFYWGSGRTHIWGDIATKSAELLFDKGLVTSPKFTAVPLSEVPELFGLAHNSKTVANRGFALGWNPRRPTLMEELPSEVDRTVEEAGYSSGGKV